MEELVTPFDYRCSIMGHIWVELRHDSDWKDFCDYHDVSLPLAYAIAEGIVEKTEEAEKWINDSWNLLMAGLEMQDQGFTSFEHMMNGVENDPNVHRYNDEINCKCDSCMEAEHLQ